VFLQPGLKAGAGRWLPSVAWAHLEEPERVPMVSIGRCHTIAIAPTWWYRSPKSGEAIRERRSTDVMTSRETIAASLPCQSRKRMLLGIAVASADRRPPRQGGSSICTSVVGTIAIPAPHSSKGTRP
jgi:hypothetical protein